MSNIDWTNLVSRLTQRWQMSPPERYAKLIVVIRHAVYDPALALALSTSGLLEMTVAPDSPAFPWIQECYQECQTWRQGYAEIEKRCLEEAAYNAEACQCILAQIGPMFQKSADLYDKGIVMTALLSDLDEDEAYDMLQRALFRLTRISTELAEQNHSWLWEYIESQGA
jgi:hypothetical protein